MWFLYQFAMAAGLAVAAPVLLARRSRHYLPTLAPRLGRLPEARGTRPLWLHAASVGEAAVAATLARALPRDLDLLVTTVTPTGQASARKLFEPLATAERSVVVTYFPFDVGPVVERFLNRFSPRALVLFESELWPLLLRECNRRSVSTVLLNARISDRSYGRMKRAGRLYRRCLLDPLGRLGAQSPQDEERLLSLGARPERTSLTGNLKFDTPEPLPAAGLERALRGIAAGRPILVAGSTMPGEERIVLDAFEQLEGEALLIVAPRHPERFDEVWRELEAWPLGALRRSGMLVDGSSEPPHVPTSGLAPPKASLSPPGVPTEPPEVAASDLPSPHDRSVQHQSPHDQSAQDPSPHVVLLDSLGELASIYRLASIAFVGGTLAPTGGHNPIEPARFGVPVVVGPSMENFRRIASDFEAAGALTTVENGGALTAAWRRLLDLPAEAAEQGRRGLALVEQNRGAVERSVEILSDLVDLGPRRADLRPRDLRPPEDERSDRNGPGAGTGQSGAGRAGSADAPRGDDVVALSARRADIRPADAARSDHEAAGAGARQRGSERHAEAGAPRGDEDRARS